MFSGHLKRLKEVTKLFELWGLSKVIIAFSIILLQSILQFGAVVTISPLMDVLFNSDSYHENVIIGFLSGVIGSTLSIQQVLLFVLIVQFLAMMTNVCSEYTKYRLYASFSYWLQRSMAKAVCYQPYTFFAKENASVIQKQVAFDGVPLFFEPVVMRELVVFDSCCASERRP